MAELVNMETAKIRQKFIDFFASQDHQFVKSSSLVPHNDPTLLFTNAGMNQFKNIFLGFDKAPAKRVVTIQKCLRAGGKHNDLESVGYTARHHTFFEMLGNFSFGDYFKQDAIRFAWIFLSSPQWLNLPTSRLLVTVYSSDEESYRIWRNDIGLPENKIIKIGDKAGVPYASDNFWQMGDTGPCGPCTEIFYDHGDEAPGGPPGSPNQEGDRFTEIWNCVFMQFNRDALGAMHPLPHPSVDTGMGLERIASVMQGVHDNYDTDTFKLLIHAAQKVVGVSTLQSNASLRVIADHIRAAAFLIADGVLPASDGRGYVLRRIIRRASRHGYQLGQKQPFLHHLVNDLILAMSATYSELSAQKTVIEKVLYDEESRFAQTLERGLSLLDDAIRQSLKTKMLSGDTVFLLYDTFGFPTDLTADICKEQGIDIDEAGFNQAMQQQKHQSQQHASFKKVNLLEFDDTDTSFEGYQHLSISAKIVALYKKDQPVDELLANDEGIVVLNSTPFYAESGGQVGDVGQIAHEKGLGLFAVSDTQKIKAFVFGHYGVVKSGALKVGDIIQASVDKNHRQLTAKNHSATHLLHSALRQILGSHVLQKGSLVTAQQIRFDFSQSTPLLNEQLVAVEDLVNQAIVDNHRILATNMSYDEAMRCHAIALFNEKYGDTVRVLAIGEFSSELCGGTHASRTGEIGLFKIISEHGVAAGVRRIEAVTGQIALSYTQAQQQLVAKIATSFKTNADQEILDKISGLQHKIKTTERLLNHAKTKLADSIALKLSSQAYVVDDIKLLTSEFYEEDIEMLRQVMDQLKKILHRAVIILVSHQPDDSLLLIAGVTDNLTHHLHAVKLVNHVAQQLEGKGGGKANMAQGACKNTPQLPVALKSVTHWIQAQSQAS